jgi:hypothetical protein
LSAIRKGLWHEIDWSSGLSIHTVVTREASCGEQGGARTREGGRGKVSAKNTKKKSSTPVEAKGTVKTLGCRWLVLQRGVCGVEGIAAKTPKC